MEWKKRVFAAAAVAVMGAACVYGSTREMADVKADETGAASWFGERDTLYFWYSDESLTNYLNSAAVAFGEREDVRVIPVLTSESEYLEAINRASLDEKQAPDAYLISNDSLEKAYLAGLASEVQDPGGICDAEHFPEAALSAVTYRDKIIAYPLFYETSALVYNESYLEQWAVQQAERELAELDLAGEGTPSPEEEVNTSFDEAALSEKTQEYLANALPATVDDILNIADTLDAPEGMESVMEWDVSDIFYNYWFVGNYMTVGGDAGDDETCVRIVSDEAIRCLEVYKALNQFFSIESDTVTYDSTIQDFIDGKVMFTVGTTDVAKRLAEAKADGSFPYEYGVTTMPDVGEGLFSRSLSVTNAVAINGYSQHRELANRFAAYLTDEYVDSLYESSDRAAANRKANADDGVLSVFAAEYARSVPLPKMLETGNYWMQLEILFSKVWNGADVTEMVQELEAQMELQMR